MSYDDVRLALEDEFEMPLTTEEEVKRAYAQHTGLAGDKLEEEFRIAVGYDLPGSPVETRSGELVNEQDLLPSD